MNLDRYLKRIKFTGNIRPDRETLNALMMAHLTSMTFENLDQQLSIPVSTKVEDAYIKVVENYRGGWCFELNALFRWALSEIGFEVYSLAGHVGNTGPETLSPASHLFLRVDCDEPLLVDVGFGGGLINPLPLSPTRATQKPYEVAISKEFGDYFRYSEKAGSKPSTFDFTLSAVEPNYFDKISDKLQTDESSPFKRTLTAQRRYKDKHVILRGLVVRTIEKSGTIEISLTSKEALVDCLREEFNLNVPEIAACWPKLQKRHLELFAEQ